MPYIEDKEHREELDWLAHHMGRLVKVDGDLNYLLFAFALRYLPCPGYQTYRNFLGELNEAMHEIRRRLLVPYEERKIVENGDVEL